LDLPESESFPESPLSSPESPPEPLSSFFDFLPLPFFDFDLPESLSLPLSFPESPPESLPLPLSLPEPLSLSFLDLLAFLPLPFFDFDLPESLSFPDSLECVARLFASAVPTFDYDLVAGIPHAGVPFATTMSIRTRKPMITPRPEKKTHGAGNMIDGKFERGQRVLLIDDLITTANTKFEAIEVLEASGLIISALVVVVDREQGGREELESQNYHLHSIFAVTELMDEYREMGLLSEELYQEIQAYRASE
jgi:uridine monophosphate synthetase